MKDDKYIKFFDLRSRLRFVQGRFALGEVNLLCSRSKMAFFKQLADFLLLRPGEKQRFDVQISIRQIVETHMHSSRSSLSTRLQAEDF